MQTLKESIREKILVSSLNEFAQYGYDKSSLRRIAEHSNITVGNIYAYYTNKDALFEAVIKPILSTINEFVEYIAKDVDLNGNYIEKIIEILFNFFDEHRKQFIIVMEVVDEKKYQSYKLEIIDCITKAIKNNGSNIKLSDCSDFTVYMIAFSFLEGVISLFKSDVSQEQGKVYMYEYFSKMFTMFK